MLNKLMLFTAILSFMATNNAFSSDPRTPTYLGLVSRGDIIVKSLQLKLEQTEEKLKYAKIELLGDKEDLKRYGKEIEQLKSALRSRESGLLELLAAKEETILTLNQAAEEYRRLYRQQTTEFMAKQEKEVAEQIGKLGAMHASRLESLTRLNIALETENQELRKALEDMQRILK